MDYKKMWEELKQNIIESKECLDLNEDNRIALRCVYRYMEDAEKEDQQ